MCDLRTLPRRLKTVRPITDDPPTAQEGEAMILAFLLIWTVAVLGIMLWIFAVIVLHTVRCGWGSHILGDGPCGHLFIRIRP